MNITPGPWSISKSSEDHWWICETDKPHRHSHFANISVGNMWGEEGKANARAIAEVPNLIEALKEFINLCPRVPEEEPIASALANQCQYAKLILKRIEG